MTSLLALYHRLPRAGRWLVWGLSMVLGYFLVAEPAVDRYNRLSLRADERATALAALNRPDPASEQAIALARRRFGAVALPGEPGTRVPVLNEKIREVLEGQGVRDYTKSSKTAQLTVGPLVNALPRERRIVRLVQEVEFTGTPEQVAAIVADLERVPEVAAVSRVTIRRAPEDAGPRMVQAIIAAEAWEMSDARRSIAGVTP